MSIMGLWAIIFSAVILAQIISAAIGTLISGTKWYRKWIMKISYEYVEESLGKWNTKSESADEEEKLKMEFIEE